MRESLTVLQAYNLLRLARALALTDRRRLPEVRRIIERVGRWIEPITRSDDVRNTFRNAGDNLSLGGIAFVTDNARGVVLNSLPRGYDWYSRGSWDRAVGEFRIAMAFLRVLNRETRAIDEPMVRDLIRASATASPWVYGVAAAPIVIPAAVLTFVAAGELLIAGAGMTAWAQLDFYIAGSGIAWFLSFQIRNPELVNVVAEAMANSIISFVDSGRSLGEFLEGFGLTAIMDAIIITGHVGNRPGVRVPARAAIERYNQIRMRPTRRPSVFPRGEGEWTYRTRPSSIVQTLEPGTQPDSRPPEPPRQPQARSSPGARSTSDAVSPSARGTGQVQRGVSDRAVETAAPSSARATSAETHSTTQHERAFEGVPARPQSSRRARDRGSDERVEEAPPRSIRREQAEGLAQRELAVAQALRRRGRRVVQLPAQQNGNAAWAEWGRQMELSPEQTSEFRRRVEEAKKRDGLNLNKNPDALVEDRIMDFVTAPIIPRAHTLDDSAIGSIFQGIDQKARIRQTRRVAYAVDGFAESIEEIRARIRTRSQTDNAAEPFGSLIDEVVLVQRGDAVTIYSRDEGILP